MRVVQRPVRDRRAGDARRERVRRLHQAHQRHVPAVAPAEDADALRIDDTAAPRRNSTPRDLILHLDRTQRGRRARSRTACRAAPCRDCRARTRHNHAARGTGETAHRPSSFFTLCTPGPPYTSTITGYRLPGSRSRGFSNRYCISWPSAAASVPNSIFTCSSRYGAYGCAASSSVGQHHRQAPRHPRAAT